MPLPYSYRYASQPVHVSHMEPTCPAPKGKEQPFEFDPALPPLVARDMDRFRRAVLTEMCCLRDQGGHEVHITNGTLVGRALRTSSTLSRSCSSRTMRPSGSRWAARRWTA